MQSIAAIALAIAVKALHPLLPGVELFQAFIEWTIASRTLGALNSLPGLSNLLVVISTGLLFVMLTSLKTTSQNLHIFYQDSAATLQAISAIMFTNSVVFSVMQTLAPSSSDVGVVAVALATGIVLAKTITSIMKMNL